MNCSCGENGSLVRLTYSRKPGLRSHRGHNTRLLELPAERDRGVLRSRCRRVGALCRLRSPFRRPGPPRGRFGMAGRALRRHLAGGLEGGPPVPLAALALASSFLPGGFAAVLTHAALLSGPWGWALVPVLAACGQPTPLSWPLAASLLAAATAAAAGWVLATAGGVPTEELSRHAELRRDLYASVYTTDFRGAALLGREATRRFVGAPPRGTRLPRPRRWPSPGATPCGPGATRGASVGLPRSAAAGRWRPWPTRKTPSWSSPRFSSATSAPPG